LQHTAFFTTCESTPSIRRRTRSQPERCRCTTQWLATSKSAIGIIIEGVFVAMIIQRLFR
jgi:hypothetical protein